MSQDNGTYDRWLFCAFYGICRTVEISSGSTEYWKYSVGSEAIQHRKALVEDLHYHSSQMSTVLKALVENSQLYSFKYEEVEDCMMNFCRIYTPMAIATLLVEPLRVLEALRVKTWQGSSV